MYGCQQVLISRDKDLINILTFLCEESHKLTNMGIYYGRQLYFKAQKGIGKFDLEKIYKTNNHYKVLHSQAGQQILRTVSESFKSYYGLIKAYQEGKITERPRIPNYRKKGGLATVSYPKQAIRLKDNGKHLKSMNRWYNKQLSTIKENKTQGFWNNKLAVITEKRNRQVKDGINKAARIVINHCLENEIWTRIRPYSWGGVVKFKGNCVERSKNLF